MGGEGEGGREREREREEDKEEKEGGRGRGGKWEGRGEEGEEGKRLSPSSVAAWSLNTEEDRILKPMRNRNSESNNL
jgi:hypothetical protein